MSDLIPIPYSIRDRHIYIAGKTRHGKSTLIQHMVYQDILNGAGVCVIDPKGDLVKSLVHYIPKSRVADTIYLDLDHPVPLDFMSYCSSDAKETLVGDLKYILTKGVSAEHAPLMHAILDDLVYTLLNANENENLAPDRRTTFIDIHEFLEDAQRRAEILAHVTDQKLKRRWANDFPNANARRPTVSRMTPFVRSETLSAIFGTPNPKLNISECMDSRKILLVDLAGVAESKMMYGSLLVARIQQAAFGRHRIHPRQRVPFFLYVDEFQNFQTSSFDAILSMAGGYGLRLTLANQFLHQIKELLPSIFGNVSSYILFRLSRQDVSLVKGEIAGGSPEPNFEMASELTEQIEKLEMELRAINQMQLPDPKRKLHVQQELEKKRIMLSGLDYQVTIDPEQLATLRPFEALYKIGEMPAVIKSAEPPMPPSEHSYADEIRANTLLNYGARFAESGQKRHVDSDPSNTVSEPVPLSEDDEVEPTSPPKGVPPHRR